MKVLSFKGARPGMPREEIAKLEKGMAEVMAAVESGDVYAVSIQTMSESDGSACRHFMAEGFEPHLLWAILEHGLTILLPSAVDYDG